MSHVLDVIIKAQDQATATTKKVADSIKTIETTTKTSTSASTGHFNTFKSKISNVASNIRQKWDGLGDALKSSIKNGLSTAGTYVTNFLRESITAAKEAQKGWIAYKNALQVVSGTTVKNLDSMKQQVVDLANTTGRTTSDTRTALTTLMNKGLSVSQAQQAAYAASGIAAAGLASDEASAATMIVQALNGRGMALKKLGINIDDYKDSVTGTIDTERLLADITTKTKGAQEEYANSAEGVANRLENSMSALKTSIGSVALQVLEPLANVLAQVVSVFNQMPGPIKTVVASGLLLFGVFATIAGPLMSMIQFINLLREAELALAVVQALSTVKTWLLTAAQWALNVAMDANPVGILVIAITALIAVLGYLYFNNETVRNSVNALGSAFNSVLAPALQFIWGCIQNTITFFQSLYNKLKQGPSQASKMVTGMLVFIATLPIQVQLIMLKVGVQIVKAGVQWLSKGVTAGKQILNGVKRGISGLANVVYTEFVNIGSKINKSVSSAVNAAKNFGNDIKEAVLNALQIHSPGIIQKKISKEFEDTSKQILNSAKGAEKAGASYGDAVMTGFNRSTFNLDTDMSRNSNLSVNQTIKLDHDFSNLPSGVSASEVARIVVETSRSDEFIKSLTGNSTFQVEDLRMKSRLEGRNNRISGV